MSKIKRQEFHRRRNYRCPINISRNVPISGNQKKSSMCMRVPVCVCVRKTERDWGKKVTWVILYILSKLN